MREIDPQSAAAYLVETGHAPADRPIEVRALAWGVSNIVLRVEVAGQVPIVLKQSRERLRTAMLWVSRLDRIWIETAALRRLGAVLPSGTVPEVLWEEPEDYLFAMTCLREETAVWKAQLLAGEVDPEVARMAGEVLGTMHAEAFRPGDEPGPLGDLEVFDGLRLDPFYRTAAAAHPELSGSLDALVRSCLGPVERTFVHADFSPKNLLVHPGGRALSVVDFETAHVGDPAFDLGFFASHLLLKALRASPGQGPYPDLIERFRLAYLDRTGLPEGSARLERASSHLAACALARVDGKSPVDYLDESRKAAVRRFAGEALRAGRASWAGVIEGAAREMRDVVSGMGG